MKSLQSILVVSLTISLLFFLGNIQGDSINLCDVSSATGACTSYSMQDIPSCVTAYASLAKSNLGLVCRGCGHTAYFSYLFYLLSLSLSISVLSISISVCFLLLVLSLSVYLLSFYLYLYLFFSSLSFL